MALGLFEILVAISMGVLLLLDVYCIIKMNMSSGIYIGIPALSRYIFLFCLFRAIHFVLLNGLSYTDSVVGLMPFFNYADFYILIIDELNNVLFFLTIFQYSLICIHSLNTHPAIALGHEQTDMRVRVLTFVVV